MRLNDSDTFVDWERIDEPGDNPTWESQCGIVEQKGHGDDALFIGYVFPDRTAKPLPTTTTLQSSKKAVEQEYQKTHKLVWNYED